MSSATPDPNEERRRKSRERVAAYRARKKELQARDARRSLRAIEQLPETEQQLIAEYLNARSSRLLSASQEAYENDLATFSLEMGASGLVGATHTDIATWISSNTRDPKNPDDARPWSRRTAQRKRSALQGFFSWAVRERRIDGNPAAGIELARYAKPPPRRIPVSAVEQIFAYIEDQIAIRDNRTRDLFLLDALLYRAMFHFGLRVSEAVSINLRRIAYVENELGHRELQLSVVRKGDKELSFPVTGPVLAAYERWKLRRDETAIHPKHRAFLCTHPWHGKRVTRKRAWRRLVKIAEAAALPDEVRRLLSPHSFRHAIAYHLLDQGYTIAEVQSFLGHSSITSTQDYVRVDEITRMRMTRDAARVLGNR